MEGVGLRRRGGRGGAEEEGLRWRGGRGGLRWRGGRGGAKEEGLLLHCTLPSFLLPVDRRIGGSTVILTII